MRHFFENQLKAFDDLALIHLLKIFSVASLCVLVYAMIFSGFQVVDEFEHLHASWLVSVGKIPYRDFFEHHNPLLWYLSAPIVRAFYDNAIVFYVMRGISFLASVSSLWLMFKIVLFFGDKRCAWFAVALYFANIITLYNFYQFRPDVFMNLCFMAGLYLWFCSLKNDTLKPLICSFCCFAFSVLFLQKISLLLLVIEVLILYLLAKKKMLLKNVAIATLPAFVLFFLFIFTLYRQSALLEYIELNFHFNMAMIDYFTRGAFWYRNLFLTVYGVMLLPAIFFYKKENIYFKIIAVLFVAEFLMRAFYFSPHPNYYTMLSMLGAMVGSIVIKKIMPQHKIITLLLCMALFIYLGHLFNKIDASSDKYNSYKNYALSDYVHKNSAPDDVLMNGYDKNFNIYRNDVSYYWFGLDMLLPIMEKEYDLEQKFDVNVIILKYRPKFIFNQDYIDLKALRTYGETRYSQRFIQELVYSLYEPTPFNNLMILK